MSEFEAINYSLDNFILDIKIDDLTIQEKITIKDVDDFFKSINFDIGIVKDFDKIYIAVSGGMDSTLLADYFYHFYPDKTIFFNCYNPYEVNKTLVEFKKRKNFIQVKPTPDLSCLNCGENIKQNKIFLKYHKDKCPKCKSENLQIEKYDYREIIKNAFLELPNAFIERCKNKYHKKLFKCCYLIKHKAYINNPLFLEDNVCVISGIKAGDGFQRNQWLKDLRSEYTSFTHKHVRGQLYVYPFRDFTFRELPLKMKLYLKQQYPNISHSGCLRCPILVLFEIKSEKKRYPKSLKYAHELGIDTRYFKNKLTKKQKRFALNYYSKNQTSLSRFI